MNMAFQILSVFGAVSHYWREVFTCLYLLAVGGPEFETVRKLRRPFLPGTSGLTQLEGLFWGLVTWLSAADFAAATMG